MNGLQGALAGQAILLCLPCMHTVSQLTYLAGMHAHKLKLLAVKDYGKASSDVYAAHSTFGSTPAFHCDQSRFISLDNVLIRINVSVGASAIGARVLLLRILKNYEHVCSWSSTIAFATHGRKALFPNVRLCAARASCVCYFAFIHTTHWACCCCRNSRLLQRCGACGKSYWPKFC